MNNRKKAILVAVALFCLNSGTFAQTVSLKMKNVSVKEAMTQLKNKSGYSFVYEAGDLDTQKTVSVDASQLAEAVKQILAGQNVSFEVKDKNIIVSKERSRQQVNRGAKRRVSGVVKDANGEPIIGATVMEKGTTNGTITDMDANFVLDIASDAELEVSYIGYKTQTIKAGDRKNLSVTLQENSEMLSEVVVVGYGSQKRANVTGAVSTITSEALNNRPVTSAAGALQGADPSLNLTFGSGSLDSDYSINIRGVASINGGSPLILADGMEVSLNQINPNDIESVSVLKDASASAVYGAKASSGVILITTKKGADTKGKATIAYNGRMAWKQNTTSTDFIRTGYDYVDLVNRFYEAYQGKQWLTYDEEGMQMLLDRRNDMTENAERPWVTTDEKGKYMYYGNFDWYGYLFNRTRPEQEHNVSVTGGTDKVNYFVSGRMLDQKGMFNIYDDNYKNYSFRAKVNAKLNDRLTYTVNVNFNSNTYKYAGMYNEQQTMYFLAYNVFPTVVPRNPDGSIVQYINQMSSNSPMGGGHAGFLTADVARNTRKNEDWVLSNELNYKVFKDLTLTASYAYKNRGRLYKYRNNTFDYSQQEGVTKTFQSGTIYDYYQESHRTIEDHNVNVYATYEHLWNKKHNFKAVAGTQFEDYRSDQHSVKKTDLLSDDLSTLGIATGEATVSQDISAWRTLGFFGRINYDYMCKYLLELSGRWDGSSRFAADDRWGFFPSASLGWRASEEKFFEPLKNIWNSAKVRFSVGSLGNQQVDNYAYFDQISADNQMSYTFDGTTKAYYASITAPKSAHLTWETVTTLDWGLDLGFLNNRLNVTADYFIRYTKDMLTTSLTLPSVYGTSTPEANCADLRTNGWEVSVSWNDQFNIGGKPFKYNISASVGDYKRVITKYNNPDKLISDYYVGKVLGEIWGYKTAGLFATDEEAAAYQAEVNDKAVNNRVYISKQDNYLRAGDVHFLDLDKNGVIDQGTGTVDNPGDKRVIGNTTPRYNYSFRLGANYCGFDFSAFFQGVGKRNWCPSQYAYDFWGPYAIPSVSFIHEDFLENCWSEENPDGYFPRQRGYQSYSSGSLGVYSDRYMQNVAYLRLKNLTLGYTLPINKKILNKVRVYVTGENLFYWSPLKKYTKTMDPELAVSSSSYYSNSGLGYTYSKSFSVGLDVTF